MAMSKTAPITNYFKRLNQSFQRKRPFPDDESEESRESSRRKSPIHEFNDNQDAHRSSDASQPSSQPSRQSLADKSPQSSPQDSPPFRQKLPARTISSPNSNKYGKPEPHQPQSRGLASPCIDKDTILTRQPDFATPAPGAAGTPSNKDKLHETPTIAPNKATTHYHSMTSSQPTLPSSQRIVRNGETMIRNSDDESDASLKDIDELFDGGRQSPEANSQLPSPDDEGSHRPKRTTRGIRPARKSHSQLPSGLPVMPKKHKFSLEALVKQKKKDEASKDEIARAESMLESYDQRKGSTGRGKGLLDTSLIDSVMKDHGDEDDIGKLKRAIQRTEALQHAKSWSFFDDDAEDTTSQVSEFPVVQDERLERLFGEPLPRQQAFLSGYAGDFATKRDLPEEILLWIMDALCMESRDDLRYSYASTLRHATEQLTPLLTPNYMDVLFQKLGAAATALNFETLIVPHATISQSVEATHRPGLLSLLAVLGSAAGDLSAESRVHLLNTLCRLTLDRSIVKSCHAIGVIEEAIASLIESLPEEDLQHEIQTVITSVYQTISDATLRLQLLQMIPAWSARLILLRQRLSLTFFFQDPRYLTKSADYTIDINLITRRLQVSQFTITNATDFSDLAASISILSIGIDRIDRPSSPCSKDAELAFNRDVDSLTSKINSMFNNIVDTGASHMKRTEAKEVLECFQRRLEYAVRTKPKPKKKMVFGEDEVVPLQEKMKAFLNDGRSTDLLATANGL